MSHFVEYSVIVFQCSALAETLYNDSIILTMCPIFWSNYYYKTMDVRQIKKMQMKKSS